MIKKLLLALCIVTSAQAHVIPFEHEELLAKLYLQVDMSATPRIVMQQITIDYIDWVNSMCGEASTKEDTIYIARLSHMFGEVVISYQYGN